MKKVSLIFVVFILTTGTIFYIIFSRRIDGEGFRKLLEECRVKSTITPHNGTTDVHLIDESTRDLKLPQGDNFWNYKSLIDTNQKRCGFKVFQAIE